MTDWLRHPHVGQYGIEPQLPKEEKVKELWGKIHETGMTDIWQCKDCRFVGYVLCYCPTHWKEMYRKSLSG